MVLDTILFCNKVKYFPTLSYILLVFLLLSVFLLFGGRGVDGNTCGYSLATPGIGYDRWMSTSLPYPPLLTHVHSNALRKKKNSAPHPQNTANENMAKIVLPIFGIAYDGWMTTWTYMNVQYIGVWLIWGSAASSNA